MSTPPTLSPEEVSRIKGRLLWFALGLPCLLVTLFSLSPWLVERVKDVYGVFTVDTVWTGRYYDNPNLEGCPVVVREDPVITFEWGEEPPFPGWEPDRFSARWVRSERFEAGLYRFAFRSDDGLRLYVDGELIYENWNPGSFDWQVIDREMTAGRHRLKVEYFEDTGDAFVQVGYSRVEE
jgi:hypothetical protein